MSRMPFNEGSLASAPLASWPHRYWESGRPCPASHLRAFPCPRREDTSQCRRIHGSGGGGNEWCGRSPCPSTDGRGRSTGTGQRFVARESVVAKLRLLTFPRAWPYKNRHGLSFLVPSSQAQWGFSCRSGLSREKGLPHGSQTELPAGSSEGTCGPLHVLGCADPFARSGNDAQGYEGQDTDCANVKGPFPSPRPSLPAGAIPATDKLS